MTRGPCRRRRSSSQARTRWFIPGPFGPSDIIERRSFIHWWIYDDKMSSTACFIVFYEQIKCMCVSNVTSLVHSYIVISVFLGLVSGLLSVHYGAFSPFPFTFLFVLVFCHQTAWMESINWIELQSWPKELCTIIITVIVCGTARYNGKGTSRY